MSKDDCIFCKIANGEIPSATVYEDSICRVILDVNPANKGHALVIPKEHYDDIYSMDADTASKIFTIATEVAKAQKAELNPDGLNIVQNNGEAAGQTVFHFHMHVIPRYIKDNVNIKWLPEKPEADELEALSKALRKRI
ncbi:MAG: HIT family protein [Coprococcus sp.]|nr:HIT family protein [Coprococcus sp.]